MTQQWSGATKWVKHHVFPRALRDKFETRFGDQPIYVDQYTLKVPDWFNKWVHSCGPRGGWWNQKWREFFARYPEDAEISPRAAFRYLRELLKQVGLEDVKLYELEPY